MSRPRKFDRDEAARMLAAGMKKREVAAALGVTREALYLAFKTEKSPPKERVAVERRAWTDEEIEQAIRRHERESVPYSVIAKGLGVTYDALKRTIWSHQRGFRRWQKQQRVARLETAETMMREGLGPTAIGQRLGLSKNGAEAFLRYHGYDAEVRRLYRTGAGT